MTRNERFDVRGTDPKVPADRRQSANQYESRRPDLEETVEAVATFVGIGLLAGTFLLATFSSRADSRTSQVLKSSEVNRPSQKQTVVPLATARVAPGPAQATNSSHGETVHTKIVIENGKIVIENGNVGITTYVLRSQIGKNVLELQAGESVASRNHRHMTLNESGSFKGIIASGTRGTVLKVGDEVISIECPFARQWNQLRMRRSQGRHASEPENVHADRRTTITDDGGA